MHGTRCLTPMVLATLLLSSAVGTGAASSERRPCAVAVFPGEQQDRLPWTPPGGERAVRADTVWFGGDDGTGVAVEGEVWDFESPGSNGLQGWSSTDVAANPGDYFGRVTVADFAAHGDPCVPIQAGNTGMLWCGIHEDEADLRDFVAGMGYQNHMCQRAYSPVWPIDPVADDVDLAFLYFNNSEEDYDYTYVEVLCRDLSGELLDTYSLTDFDGVIGDPAALASFDPAGAEIPAGTLDPATATIQLELRMESDGGYSDEDGYWDTPCGPFGADDLVMTIGSTAHAFDFEDGQQGWSFERCAGTGSFMALHDEAIWRDWVEDVGVACGCPLSGQALGFVDAEHSPYSPPGLVPGQKEQAASAIVPRAGYGLPEWSATVVAWDSFLRFPQSTGAYYRPGWRIYPYTTESNPVPHWSGRHGRQIWYYTSAPSCAQTIESLSSMANEPLPAAWDSLRFTYEVWCSCDAFSTPASVCTEEGATGGAPLLDHIRVGLTHVPDAPTVTESDGGNFMDSYGQNFPTYLEPTDRGNSNISYDMTMSNTEQNDWHGDSSVVSGPIVSSEATRFLCQLCFRIPRTGARQHLIPEYHLWKSRLVSDPEEDFICVLMDSLETNNHTQIWKNKFATYFHEDDPGFDPADRDFRPAQEILPDGVFVPGTRVEYYFRSYYWNGGAPPDEYFVLGPWEYEMLPTMTIAPGEEYAVQWPSVLFVDAFNRGSERFIDATLTEAGLSYDRFDYLDNSS